MAVPWVLRLCVRACSSKRTRSNSIFMFSISPASGEGDRGQESMGRIKSPVSIVAGKRLLVRPAIADIPQLAH